MASRGVPLQASTAIGRIVDDAPYQVEVAAGFAPRRCRVEFLPRVAAPIRPLLDALDFVEDPKQWDCKFRFGPFRIDDSDLELIKSVMTGGRVPSTP